MADNPVSWRVLMFASFAYVNAEGNREYLPFDPSMPCVQDQFDASGENINCFMAGDPR